MEEPQYKRAGRIIPDQEIRKRHRPLRSFQIRLRWRLVTWAAVLLIGLLAVAPDPRAFHLIPLYPIGFDRAIHTSREGGDGVVGYLAHLVLFLSILAANRKSVFFLVTLMLIMVCALTTKGCHEILSGLSIDG